MSPSYATRRATQPAFQIGADRVVSAPDRGASDKAAEKTRVTPHDLVQFVSDVDMTQAEESTLRKLDSALMQLKQSVEARLAEKKRSGEEVTQQTSDANAMAKKLKRLERLEHQLCEDVSKCSDMSLAGRGMFATPTKRIIAAHAAGVPAAPASKDGHGGVIRIGPNHQAEVPRFNTMVSIKHRGDQLVQDPAGDEQKQQKQQKQQKACGTPGCIFHDYHSGPHSNDASLSSRRVCPPALATAQDDKPVVLDERRTDIIDKLKKKHGSDFGGDNANVDQVSDHFKVLLLLNGYKDGSVCKAGKCTLDGVAEKYPRYLRLFMNSEVFNARSDFFLEGAKDKATEFAKKFAIECAKRSTKYNFMSEAEKAYFLKKQRLNIMHGFCDFVHLSGK
tara:strand:+ start:430 stop:1602 length:1173 start_codon:yes stop_codon:yes gene_type:complete